MTAPRSNLARVTIRLMRLLRQAPHRRADLMDVLGVSRPTVDRLLQALEEEGEPLAKDVRGREAWYSLDGSSDLHSQGTGLTGSGPAVPGRSRSSASAKVPKSGR